MRHWALNEHGGLRKELYTVSREELDAMEINGIAGQTEWHTFPESLKSLEPGDIIWVRPEYSIAERFGGRLIFRQLSGNAIFTRTSDGGGGFIGEEMLVNINNPKRRDPDALDPNRRYDAKFESIRKWRVEHGTWPPKLIQE